MNLKTKHLIMYNLNKKEKLNFILEKTKELGFTAYEISKETNLTEAGISRILKGIAKNPHENSLNQIIEFLEKKNLRSELNKISNKVEEPKSEYKKESGSYLFENNPLVICLNEKAVLIKEIIKLQILLNENNIPYKNIFEEE